MATIGCPPGALDTFDASTNSWTSNCASYCAKQFPQGGDLQNSCITTCDNNQACHPEIPAPISGADVINSAIIAAGGVPPNAACWAPMVIQGPMNGADPGDKLFVGGGRMLGDGQLRNGEYLNMYTAQGVSTAFKLAGIPTNTVISKASNSKPVQGVNIVDPTTGVTSGAAFNYLGGNNWVPYTQVNSAASGAALPIPGIVQTPTGVGMSAIPGHTSVPVQSGPSSFASVVGPAARSVQIGGTSIYATTSAQPRAAASSLASIMSSSPAGTPASTYTPGQGAFGRRFATTYSCY